MSQKIVFTYGVFDLLHPGHIRFLKAAKELGDTLILALVSDESVKMVKGPDKPIMCLADRIEVLGALRYVDKVVSMDTYNPVPTMEHLAQEGINIDILVKGDDWEYIPGTEFVMSKGGKLVKLPYTDGVSTSALIKKMKNGESFLKSGQQ